MSGLLAALCALNVACYVGAGHHWWNAASAVFVGLIAIFLAMDEVR